MSGPRPLMTCQWCGTQARVRAGAKFCGSRCRNEAWRYQRRVADVFWARYCSIRRAERPT